MYYLLNHFHITTNINEASFQIDAICKNELSQRPFSTKFGLLTQAYKVESKPVFIRRLNQIILVKDQLKELVKTEDVKEIYLVLEHLEPQKAHVHSAVNLCLEASYISI